MYRAFCYMLSYIKFFTLFLCVQIGISPACMSVHLHACSAGGSQKRAPDLGGLELQVIVSCYVGAGNQTPGPLEGLMVL